MSLLLTMIDTHDCERFIEVEDFEELKRKLRVFIHALKWELSDIIDDTRTATFFVVEYEDGIYIQGLDEGSFDQWWKKLAKTLAFDDCTGERILYIMYKGKELMYTGWKPGMTYEFADKKGNTIWSASFPEWDH